MKKKFLLICTLCLGALTVFGQVGVGTTTPDKAAILDLVSNDKGMLIPRVNLTSNDMHLDGDDQTVQPEGLFVYNTGTTLAEGYYYWSGSEWRSLESTTMTAPSIADLLCNAASLSPAAYYGGEPYTGVLRIPYTGGNGGRYEGGTSVTANGLTFTLQNNKLNIGNGDLVFNVSGTPDYGSPFPTEFVVNNTLIPFYTNGPCNIKVGDRVSADVKTIAVMAPLTYTNEIREGYQTYITTPDGKFSIRCFVPKGIIFARSSLQIRSNTSSTVNLISNAAIFKGSGTDGRTHNNLVIPGNVWCGSGANDDAAQNAEVQTASNNPCWGYRYVFESNTPENRLYAFTTHDQDEKVFYNLRFMMTSLDTTADDASCPNGTCGNTKVFLRVEQITAP